MIKSMVGGGGGVEVQTKTGTFTTNNSGSATINCGFKPDAVRITSNVATDALNAIFYGGSASSSAVTYSTDGNYAYVGIDFTQSSSGFTAKAAYCNWSFNWTSIKSKSFSYVALKYS